MRLFRCWPWTRLVFRGAPCFTVSVAADLLQYMYSWTSQMWTPMGADILVFALFEELS